jgi:hypothetical protein
VQAICVPPARAIDPTTGDPFTTSAFVGCRHHVVECWRSGGTWDNLRGMDAETVRAMLLRNLGHAADDPVGSHDMYHDDAVLEFPQSGERFEGVANIREWRSRYPGSVTYDIRRIRGADDIWVAEMTVSYDGGEPRYGVDLLEIRNGKIVRETVYVGEPFDAPAWRAQWRVAP